jgi:hypothetical protein
MNLTRILGGEVMLTKEELQRFRFSADPDVLILLGHIREQDAALAEAREFVVWVERVLHSEFGDKARAWLAAHPMPKEPS